MSKRHPITPVAPPRLLKDIFTDDENRRLFNVLHTRGPWPMIAGIYFKTVEELLAISMPLGGEGRDFKMEDFLTPSFRGFFGNNGMPYEEEVHDISIARNCSTSSSQCMAQNMAHHFCFSSIMLAHRTASNMATSMAEAGVAWIRLTPQPG